MAIHHISSFSGNVSKISTNLPTIISKPIPSSFHKHFIKIMAFDRDTGKQVSLDGGTLTIKASDNGIDYGSIANGSINIGADSSYSRPNVLGVISHIQVDGSGLQASSLGDANKHNLNIRFEIHSYN